MIATATIKSIDASTLFQSAYENRYTWDTTFSGFKASAHLQQNENIYQADIIVSPNLKEGSDGLRQHHHDEYQSFNGDYILTSSHVSTVENGQKQEFRLTNISLLDGNAVSI